MPKIGSVKFLQRICVAFVTDNMAKFSQKSLTGELEAIDSDVCSFKELPSAVLEELVKALMENRETYRQFINLLIVPNLRTLNLSRCWKEDLLHLLPLAAKNSPNLTCLLITGHQFMDSYLSLIPTFTQLRELNINKTSIPDNCLNLLGSHCRDLRELYATDCMVTDAGIEGLCVVGRCKSIQILNILRTKVTFKGIVMALEHLPSLRKLEHHSICEVLDQVYKKALDKNLSDIPKFSLSSIQIINYTRNWNINLARTVFLCPLITEVTIYGKLETLTDEDLLGLLQLEKVEILTISGYGNINLTFDGCIAPLLKARGISLKQLELAMVHEVDRIPLIAQFCSNLRSLSLCYFSSYNLSWLRSQRNSSRRQRNKLEQPILKYLERLNLTDSNGIFPESLCLLLSSPTLKFINITSCDTFTEDVLQQAANLHSFYNLESFEMHDCKLVTIKILKVLLQETIPLNKVWLTWKQKKPKNISKILRLWEKEKDEKNWDLKIMVNFKYRGEGEVLASEEEISVGESDESSNTEEDEESLTD